MALTPNVLNYFEQTTSGGDNPLNLNGTVKRNGLIMQMPVMGNHTVTSGEATANTVTIATGLATVSSAQVQVVDASNKVVTADAVVSFSAGNITVADGTTFNLTAGYVIRYLAVGNA